MDIGVIGFDKRLINDLFVFIIGARLFRELGDGERRSFVVDWDGIGNVFGTTSNSYSGMGSI